MPFTGQKTLWEKGENAGFFPFPKMFYKGLFLRVVKSPDYVAQS